MTSNTNEGQRMGESREDVLAESTQCICFISKEYEFTQSCFNFMNKNSLIISRIVEYLNSVCAWNVFSVDT